MTIAEPLSDAVYRTALVGKGHLGSHEGRLPNDQGFDEWFGSARTTNESQWSSQVGWSAETAPLEQGFEGIKGDPSRNIVAHDIEQRRLIDPRDHPPFFLYATLTQPHLPTLPNPAFAGDTGNGDWADMLGEMDNNVCQMLAAADDLGVRDNIIVIFTSDNDDEFLKPWDGWSGP